MSRHLLKYLKLSFSQVIYSYRCKGIKFYTIFVSMESVAQISNIDQSMDAFEIELSKFEPIENPLIHVFTKGLYTRQIFMPAYVENSKGEIVQNTIISKIHKTQHTFVILRGVVSVFNKLGEEACGLFEAPFLGITEAGTRRILVIHEDCIWQTSHPLSYITGEENNWSDEEKKELLMRIEKDLIEQHFIGGLLS